MKVQYIDTHAHLDGEEFRSDLPDVIRRAQDAGVSKIILPGINLESIVSKRSACQLYPHYLYPMIGLQPEEVKADFQEVLRQMKQALSNPSEQGDTPYIGIGECGLDFYWSREFEQEQLAAFEEQVRWSVEYQLPLAIHCRKAQSELLHIMKPYEDDLPGGIFHCFTGNQQEAHEYLKFERFCLGIGGVSTFKSSHLREDLPAAVPMSRIVLETDSPYMAPVPHRGERNESAFLAHVLHQLAESYGVSDEEMAAVTNCNVKRLFGKLE